VITLLDYFPELTEDSEKYLIPLNSVNLSTFSNSKVYFALLNKILSYSLKELRISASDYSRALLTEAVPLISINRFNPTIEYHSAIENVYSTFAEEFAVRIQFKIIAVSTLLEKSFTIPVNFYEVLNWNSTHIFIYKIVNYYPNWNTISGSQLLTYLLHMGLLFRLNQAFSLFYNATPITVFEDGVMVSRTEFRFFATFKTAIPDYYSQITAQEVL